MKPFHKLITVVTACLLVLNSLSPGIVFAATTDTLISQFSYSGGTAGADIAGDKDSGYAVSLGNATVHASVNGSDARKLEWTSDLYVQGNTSAVQPTMTAGNNNPWATGAYIETRLSTVGYTDITFSAKLGGTKKGPRDFKLQYSLDGIRYTDVGVSYSITTNKVMEQAFDTVALPADAANAPALYIRMVNTSDILINGSSGLSGATGGETAVNDIVITGIGNVVYYPQGDVSRDGNISSVDVRGILKIMMNVANADDLQLLLGDIDGDGDVDSTDARSILTQMASGIKKLYKAASNGLSDTPSAGTRITLLGTTATVEGSGATVSGDTVTITDGGHYTVVGTMTDGQLIVAADDTLDQVAVTLDNVTMSCSDSAPFYVQSADKTTLILKEGTTNTFSDTANYVFADGTDEPASPIYSKDDLVIEGTGTLIVNGKYKNGITSKDDLKINGGTYIIDAVNHGIRGKDSIRISDGDFTVTAGADGMQSDNTEDTTKGYITIDGGVFDITAANDGIQAETALSINGGTFTIVTGGGSATSPSSSDTNSYKGIKSTGALAVCGGSITLDCKDDAVHANGDVTLAGGVINAASGDDGVHADGLLLVNDGASLTVTKSYEAIEGVNITVTGGEMRLTSSDDGINAAGGTDDNTGYWYVQNNLLYLVSESASGYQWTLNTDIPFDVNEQIYLVTDLNSTAEFDILLDITTDAGHGTPAFSTDWYPAFGATDTDVTDGYLPATNGSVTAALDLYNYFTYNGIPSDGQACVDKIIVKTAGTGTLCLGALQASNTDSIAYPALTASGSTLTAGETASGVVNLLSGVAATATSASSSSSGGSTMPGMGGMGGMGGMESTSVGSLTVTGGYVAVYAGGDGVDINGDAVMTGGTVVVHGPTDSGNGFLDFDGTFDIDGGTFIAAGSSGMLQTPSSSSAQYMLSIKSSSSRSAGTAFGILDAAGNTILAFKPSKTYQAVLICSPDIVKGTTYTAYYGGTCSGELADGLYETYTAGTSLGSASVSSIITSIGSNSGSNRPSRP
ncbi:MAG: carbohydrate-binding domain-containing protein [Ruminococcaceae bacterium]|nr:carbohydrate-binding domain-containing protein [Oscillospiraceae bacterium]